jgi:hypothetical protein
MRIMRSTILFSFSILFFISVKMVFGDGESLTPAYKKSDRQTLPECGMVWLSRFRSVLNVWQVSWTAVSNARFLSCFKMP